MLRRVLRVFFDDLICRGRKHTLAFPGLCALMFALVTGCASYKGGKVVDGTNLEIGMTVPGTEWSLNFLAYTGGIKVAGNDRTAIVVTNAVTETNSYFFGAAEMRRTTKMTAKIEPSHEETDTNRTDSLESAD